MFFIKGYIILIRGEQIMSRDNISGVKGNNFITSIFLIPGKVIQWFMYMSVGSQKGYGKVRQQTRMARSPLMCFFYSILSWGGLIFYFLYEYQMLHPEFYN